MGRHIDDVEAIVPQGSNKRLRAEMKSYASELVKAFKVRCRGHPALSDEQNFDRCHRFVSWLFCSDAVECAPWVGDHQCSNLIIRNAMALQSWYEMTLNIGIPKSAVTGQHHLEEHVLRQEQII